MIFKSYRFYILVICCLLVVSYIGRSTTEPILRKIVHKNLELSLNEETKGDTLQPIGKMDREQNLNYIKLEEEKIVFDEPIVREKANIKDTEIDKDTLKKIQYTVKLGERSSDEEIIMACPMGYDEVSGITTFRGNPYRNSAAYGVADIKQEKLEVLWSMSIGALDRWTGVGWNGQPAIVQWSKEQLSQMNISPDKAKNEGLTEVIYGTLDGNVYFIDIMDGKQSRNPIKLPASIKGSVTVDPRGIPLLYVGQGINTVNGKRVEIGYRVYSLIDQQKLLFINGVDSFAYRGWGAFDSTALIDKETDTMLVCGENGIFYRVKLNTDYDKDKNKISIYPIIDKYKYKIQGNSYQGIENSVAVYKNLAYFADNGGWIQCIDINELKPLWILDVTDDTDSTIVIDEEGDEVYLYTSNEVDKQGVKGKSYIRKIDALSGKIVWENYYICHSKLEPNPNNGGALATPIVGKHDMDDLIIYNLARYGGFNKGLVIALNKRDGKEVWRIELNNYSWSSPVDIYTEEGKGYIILCDSGGSMYLIEGTTGKILDKISLGSNVEGSPAVFNDIAVVGTRGQKIFGIKIK